MDTEDLPTFNEKEEFEEEVFESENYNDIPYETNDIDEVDIKQKIGSLMNFLSEKERNIITEYYGLDGSKPKTLDEIGKEFGISKERIRQINANSFKKMRSAALSFNMSETIYNK